MTRLIKRSITLVFVSLFLWGGVTAIAEANPIWSQTNRDTSYQTTSALTLAQTLGVAQNNGTIEEITLSLFRDSGSSDPSIAIVECTDGTYTSCNTLGTIILDVVNDQDTIVNGVFSVPLQITAGKYYAWWTSWNAGVGNNPKVRGSSGDSYANGEATTTISGAGVSGASMGAISDFYFNIKGSALFAQLGFVGSYSPATFEATSSPVFFELVYYLDTVTLATEYIGVAYNYDTGSSVTLGKYTLPSLDRESFETATQTIAFTEDGSYSVNWFLVDPDNEYGTVGVPVETTFSINATSSFFETPAIRGINNDIASTSCNINFLGTFNLGDCVTYLTVPSSNVYGLYGSIPSLIGTRFPFSYIKSIQDTWKSLASTASTSPTLSYNLHDLGIGSTSAMGNFLPNITIFSKETINTYLPDPVLDIFKSLIAMVFIVLTFANIYTHTQRLIHHT